MKELTFCLKREEKNSETEQATFCALWYHAAMNDTPDWITFVRHEVDSDENDYVIPPREIVYVEDTLRYRKDENGELIVQRPIVFHTDRDGSLSLLKLQGIFSAAPESLDDVVMDYYDTDTGMVRADFYGWTTTIDSDHINAAKSHIEEQGQLL